MNCSSQSSRAPTTIDFRYELYAFCRDCSVWFLVSSKTSQRRREIVPVSTIVPARWRRSWQHVHGMALRTAAWAVPPITCRYVLIPHGHIFDPLLCSTTWSVPWAHHCLCVGFYSDFPALRLAHLSFCDCSVVPWILLKLAMPWQLPMVSSLEPIF